MPKIRAICITLSIMACVNKMYAFQLYNISKDTTKIFEIIKANEKKFKLQKSKFLTQINSNNNDSSEIYSQNKSCNQITLIKIVNNMKTNEESQTTYWFIDNKIFKISINFNDNSSFQKKERHGVYFFSKDSLIYHEQKNIALQDINLLLMNAKRYLSKGTQFLREKR